MKKIIVAFGRMNPITSGHGVLVDKMNKLAKSEHADSRLYLSHTTGKKDPLSYNQKIKYAQEAFGKIAYKSSARSMSDMLKEVQSAGYTDVILVAGGADRVADFEKSVKRFSTKFDNIKVVSAGNREDGGEGGSQGVSASRMRSSAKSGDIETFKAMAHKKLSDKSLKDIYKTISGKEMMSEEILDEGLELIPQAMLGIYAAAGVWLWWKLGGAGKLKDKAVQKIRDIKLKKGLDQESIDQYSTATKEYIQSLSGGKKRFITSLLNKYKKTDPEDKDALLAITKDIQKYIDKYENERIRDEREEKAKQMLRDGRPMTHVVKELEIPKWLVRSYRDQVANEETELDEATGAEVKKWAKAQGISIKVRKVSGKNPFLQIRSGDDKPLPNDLVKKAIIAQYGKVPDAVKDTSNIDYGNFNNRTVSLGVDAWGKVISEETELDEVTSAQRVKTSLKRGRALRKGTGLQKKLARRKKIVSRKKGQQLKNVAKNSRRTAVKQQRRKLVGGAKLKSGAGGVAKRVRSSALFDRSTGAKTRAGRSKIKIARASRKRIIRSSFEALLDKAQTAAVDMDIVMEVYYRGCDDFPKYAVGNITEEQFAFSRVNSFLAGGAASKMDADLYEMIEEDGGAGEWGTDQLRKKYCEDTPGQTQDINTMYDKYQGTVKPEVGDTYVNLALGKTNEAFEALDEMKGVNLLRMVQQAVKSSTNPKAFEKAVKTMQHVRMKRPEKSAGNVLNSVAGTFQLGNRELQDYIKKQIKAGKVPASILEDNNDE
jgi:hypothetical protein